MAISTTKGVFHHRGALLLGHPVRCLDPEPRRCLPGRWSCLLEGRYVRIGYRAMSRKAYGTGNRRRTREAGPSSFDLS